jgi:hypothetical protein
LYAVAAWTIGNLKAVWIAIAIPGELIDIKVFRVGIIREILLSSSIEILISDCSNSISRCLKLAKPPAPPLFSSCIKVFCPALMRLAGFKGLFSVTITALHMEKSPNHPSSKSDL